MSTGLAVPVDHLSVTSNSVTSQNDPGADIQYLKGFLPQVLFWTSMTEKVEENASAQSQQVELLRSRLPAEYMPEKHSIDLVNTMQVVVAALLALTDGKLVPGKSADATPAKSPEPIPEPIELSAEEEITTSPVIVMPMTPRPEARPPLEAPADDAMGVLGDLLKRESALVDEVLDAAVPMDMLKVDTTAELRTPRSAAVQPGSEPEPSLAGRSYTCTDPTEASELGDSQRHIELAGPSQTTRPADVRDPRGKAAPEEVPEKGSEKDKRSDGGSEWSEKPKALPRLDLKPQESVHGSVDRPQSTEPAAPKTAT